MKLAFALVLLAGTLAQASAQTAPLVGSWQLISDDNSQAGLYVFTPTRYSMTWATTTRPDIADTSKATADELRTLWGPLIANAGTYDVTGDRLTIHPFVAKSSVVMKPGANEVYQFQIAGKTLTLRQVRNARGLEVSSAPTFKFLKVE